ncbi:universal stress protein [Paenibacillus sp. HWE-109]|uniref:universal stress protein n=1 Tax=Paenibacillus sp. HWE-109 TaxID=1306526 RepID=UPI001EDEA6F9|nr:universal stress protein [Paenibacillus sp. HWE-109]UKS30910.1 universal stress protein [Paenibacillus sp. HWE-109]
MYKHILVPIDGSQQADRALEHAIALAQTLSPETKLTILYVSQLLTLNEPTMGVVMYDNMEDQDRQVIQPAAAKLAASNVNFTIDTKTGDPASVICYMADYNKCDLIVMGSRGVGLMSEILLGSVSHGVIQHAHCPVLIIK